MRNLLQYTITRQEVLDDISTIPYDPSLIGGTVGMIKIYLVSYLVSHPEQLEEIVASMRCTND